FSLPGENLRLQQSKRARPRAVCLPIITRTSTAMKTISSPADLAPDTAAPMTNVRWRIFLILLLLTAINYIDRASLSVALPLIAPEFNLTPAMEGLMLSAFFWSYALMQIPGGLSLDRFHTRGIIGGATVAWGAFQAMGAASHHWLVLLFTRIG